MPYTSRSSTVLMYHTTLCIPRRFFVLWDVKFVTVRHWLRPLSQLNAFHITTFYFHFAVKYYLHLGLPSGFFPCVLCASTHPQYVSPPAHPPLFDITNNNNTSEVYHESFVKHILSFFQSLCNSLCLESKYSPQHHIPICPILGHGKCVCPLLSAGTYFRLCLW